MNRRGFLGALCGMLIAPYAKAVEIVQSIPLFKPKVTTYPNLSEIVTTTLRNRTAMLADNFTKNNALLSQLTEKEKR